MSWAAALASGITAGAVGFYTGKVWVAIAADIFFMAYFWAAEKMWGMPWHM